MVALVAAAVVVAWERATRGNSRAVQTVTRLLIVNNTEENESKLDSRVDVDVASIAVIAVGYPLVVWVWTIKKILAFKASRSRHEVFLYGFGRCDVLFPFLVRKAVLLR